MRLVSIFTCVLLLVSFGAFAYGKNAPAKDSVQVISEQTNMPVEKVNELKTKNYCYGDMMILSEMSKQSNQPVDTIITDRNSGMTWNDIAKKYNVNMGKVISSSHKNLNKAKRQFANKSEFNQARNTIKNAEKEQVRQTTREMKQTEKETKNEMKHQQREMEHNKVRTQEKAGDITEPVETMEKQMEKNEHGK